MYFKKRCVWFTSIYGKQIYFTILWWSAAYHWWNQWSWTESGPFLWNSNLIQQASYWHFETTVRSLMSHMLCSLTPLNWDMWCELARHGECVTTLLPDIGNPHISPRDTRVILTWPNLRWQICLDETVYVRDTCVLAVLCL